METMEKPRLKYSPEHFAARKALGYPEGTFALLIQKYIDEAKQPGSRPIGQSKGYSLQRWQRAPIGGKQQGTLRVLDLMDHGKRRKAEGVKPPTVLNDVATFGAVLRHAVEVWEMVVAEADLNTLRKAKKQLEKNQLIGKSIPRDRLPTDEEEAILRAYYVEKNKSIKKNKIDMVLVMDGEFKTGRRISELCRIERQHVNVQARTCSIFDLKNSKGKGFHGEFALIEGAWELFERRLNEIPQEPTARLFPFNPKSCGASYTRAKKELAELHPGLFQNLRMHDNRAECFVRLLDKGYSAVQVQKGVSLHKDLKTLVGSYVRIKAIDLHKGPAAQYAASAAPR